MDPVEADGAMKEVGLQYFVDPLSQAFGPPSLVHLRLQPAWLLSAKGLSLAPTDVHIHIRLYTHTIHMH